MSDEIETFEYVPESEDLFDFDELLGPGDDSSSNAADTIDLEELVAALPDLGEGDTYTPPAAEPARQAPASPEPASASDYAEPGTVVVAGGGLSPAAAGMLVVVTLLNVVLIGFTWRTNQRLEDKVHDVSLDVIRQATELREDASAQRSRAEEILRPVVAPEAEDQRSFDLVRQDLERQDYGSARRKLYSILAVLDRFDDSERDDVEARARYMLADTLVVEASAPLSLDSGQELDRP